MLNTNDATILAVDDAPENLALLAELLQPHYTVRAAINGEKALAIAAGVQRPDLILLDVMMPGMDGYEVFARLRADPATQEIPVIFITALSAAEDELRGFGLGAADYITKPIVPAVTLARIRTHLELKRTRDYLKGEKQRLEIEVQRRMGENDATQQVSIRALAHLAETRDPETGNHILRTQSYVNVLALRLRDEPRDAAMLTDRYIDLLTRSAPLHDIGKVGIPDAILLKPGPLDPDQWTIMKTHAQIGADAIEQAERDVERKVEFLAIAKEIAGGHHERWDGTGYPQGLAGEAIPLSARLMALADVFDALISVRVYKPAMPYAQAYELILQGRGTHFDPLVVDAFVDTFDTFCTIADRYSDGH
jgi:putative two-component system response regulator